MGKITEKTTYLTALYGITPDQIEELKMAICYTQDQIAWDIGTNDPHELLECAVDADRLQQFAGIGDWWKNTKNKMLVAFDVMDLRPDKFWREIAKRDDIKMWTLRR